ncbi:MAG TPA: hypothetical protein VFC00_22495 [Micromonosporaceae bacterium]|nr:hypothetical protein [Micromonosporaceae bacterium]
MSCYTIISAGPVPASINFELDLAYGASTVSPPLLYDGSATWGATVYSLEGENISTHRIKADGFRLEGDGNRIEIATKPFELNAAGRTEMRSILSAVLDVADQLRDGCAAAHPARLGFPPSVGEPQYFAPAWLEPAAACVFPLGLSGKDPYYRNNCGVWAAPQATFSLPLAKIDDLVTRIQKSEGLGVAGRAWSGPSGWRQGVRSVALYEAQRFVNASRLGHLRAKTVLSDGTVVTDKNFTPAVQGLLILMVSYLRTGGLPYVTGVDYEVFPKAYLPLNSKTPFRLLYDDLSDAEKAVFSELYGGSGARTNLWRLADPTATASAGSTKLFPPRTHLKQLEFFTTEPTWDEFVELTMTNTPLLRTVPASKVKKGEDVGCEVLFAPLSRIMPYEVGSLRLTVEMRRLGFNWVPAHPFTDKKGTRRPGWKDMVEALYRLALDLNGVALP